MYNGHKNWAYWNVSLWINNDEGLYNLALDAIRQTKNRKQASEYVLNVLRECGQEKTPDGARYSKNTIIHAMRGMS